MVLTVMPGCEHLLFFLASSSLPLHLCLMAFFWVQTWFATLNAISKCTSMLESILAEATTATSYTLMWFDCLEASVPSAFILAIVSFSV